MATSTAQAIVRALTTNEQAGNGGFTHEVGFGNILGAGGTNRLSNSTADEDMTFNLFATLPGDVIVKWALILDPAVSDASDAAFNSVAFSFGDEDSGSRFLSAVQTNVNGTEVIYTYGNTAYTYLAIKQVNVLIESMTAKKLSELDGGRIVLLFELLRLQTLTKAITG